MCQSQPTMSSEHVGEDMDCCWICLGTDGMLSRPCMCPRSVHPTCLARWQLQQAGRQEERSCRFCNASLPDWKSQLAPSPPAPVDPVMVVSLGGKAVKIRVKPGPEGMAHFRQQVRELFNIPSDVEFECSFKCKAPSGDTIQLEGLASYDAATHCASLMAAQRAAAASRRPPTQPTSAPASVPTPMSTSTAVTQGSATAATSAPAPSSAPVASSAAAFAHHQQQHCQHQQRRIHNSSGGGSSVSSSASTDGGNTVMYGDGLQAEVPQQQSQQYYNTACHQYSNHHQQQLLHTANHFQHHQPTAPTHAPSHALPYQLQQQQYQQPPQYPRQQQQSCHHFHV
ncbi:hypothetical protein Agub_g2872 [Astrephomene gubernaculifera]|uniref:RING-CH-type domain-containing protein n=1 Tax=Astrephomene gubernaculifera TaxID=47775 RepID=A0AAD3DHR1_9CHLO|nr:hypothetical protein Agub_g2872 [Astrephomene gubernaculifera]